MSDTRRMSKAIFVRWLHPSPSTISVLLSEARILSGGVSLMLLGHMALASLRAEFDDSVAEGS